MENPAKAGFAPLLATRATARGRTVSLPKTFRFPTRYRSWHIVLVRRRCDGPCGLTAEESFFPKKYDSKKHRIRVTYVTFVKPVYSMAERATRRFSKASSGVEMAHAFILSDQGTRDGLRPSFEAFCA